MERRPSNLQSFLDHVTPVVHSHTLPKTCFRDVRTLWPPIDNHKVEFFTLGDLWDRYYEWSVYGAGVPVRLNNGKTVVQYYVPYLSAIQLYTSKSLDASRSVTEDSESDSWSDDSESEKRSRSWDGTSEDSAFEQDAQSPTRERIGQLYIEYIERSGPYGRMPLINKVYELAKSHPGLLSLKSVELSPASWMSVAWYPIYHIPAKGKLKDLAACFLTYHTISSSFQDTSPSGVERSMPCTKAGKCRRKSKETESLVSLSSFGLATYKMLGNFWINPETSDHETKFRLFSAADSWLKQLSVQHHDFNFFLGRPV